MDAKLAVLVVARGPYVSLLRPRPLHLGVVQLERLARLDRPSAQSGGDIVSRGRGEALPQHQGFAALRGVELGHWDLQWPPNLHWGLNSNALKLVQIVPTIPYRANCMLQYPTV